MTTYTAVREYTSVENYNWAVARAAAAGWHVRSTVVRKGSYTPGSLVILVLVFIFGVPTLGLSLLLLFFVHREQVYVVTYEWTAPDRRIITPALENDRATKSAIASTS